MTRRNTRLEKVWAPIIIALIGTIGVIIAALISSNSGKNNSPSVDIESNTPQVSSFEYQVRVLIDGTESVVQGAKVTIETSNVAPKDDFTDSDGLARIFIDASRTGKPGRLIIEANGFNRYIKNIDLDKGELPTIIFLEKAP